MWGLKFGFGDSIAGMPTDVDRLASSPRSVRLPPGVAALSFFAGVDELVDYVFNETQFDKLTGLQRPHRHGRQDRGSGGRTIKTGEPVFLIDIDIDRFKQINDSIGYSQGDELIRAFAKRLQASLPERLGPRPDRRGRVRRALPRQQRRQSRSTGSSRN